MSESEISKLANSRTWTIEALLEHFSRMQEMYAEGFDSKLQALREYSMSALQAADRAVTKAEAANEKRFESVNEFRAALSDQQRSFIPRSEFQVVMEGHAKLLAALAERINTQEGRSMGSGSMLGFVVGIIGMLLGIAMFFYMVTK
ncbi:MAG: hypothetical protein JW730_18235 [Anaerolineales bacterium]|nr:hypothetical protein [Anaerolineales bacterium]